MVDHDQNIDSDAAEELLRSALLDDSSAVCVCLRVGSLPVSEAVTIIFYARRDLGMLQTYLAPGSHGAGTVLAAGELLRVPCDLDLASAEDREDAERLYAHQARLLRDAVVGADVVLDVWRKPLCEGVGAGVKVDRSAQLTVRLPVPRLLPTALVWPDAHIVVTPVCCAQTLAEGRPPMGIACSQQDLTKVYRLTDDPERCVADFLQSAAEHAREFEAQLAHKEASVERFLELSDG
ncbi:MAG: hypothetical protein ACLP0J_26535 [Solirubrobacteraceae bacterium]|jgi:hypothetical protein